MRLEILGSAAGGGFPQWNCNCENCRDMRAGTFSGTARTQTQLAVSYDSRSWFLLNASPDLRLQIESSSFLHPREGQRHSPIAGVLVTGADVDQVAGLLTLREFQPFQIYCTPSVACILRRDNSIFRVLNRISNQVSWTEIKAEQSFPLLDSQGNESGIRATLFDLGGHYPDYIGPDRAKTLRPEEAQVGVILQSSQRTIAYLPTISALNHELLQQLKSADLFFFDGTFWSDDELRRVKGSGPTAREMGHVPVSGPEGSLQMLAGLRHPRKVYIHINNTNPMLNESGPEYRRVRDAGWEIAADGMRFEI
ncbi:MAG: pyrroloquinoline quinone biosynthesis protein PqqB [Acidobacteriaceae bacterium]|nr:pyrroloquinoline quinone biosynthesis protein PqqB [Acidobacteriaceae bacterium]